VTAEGNYYLKRTGFNEPIDWDVLLTLDAPIFTGGQFTGSVRTAESDRRAAELRLARARREAEREIRERHQNVTTFLNQAAALARAADLADENHRLQAREYRLGLVTNLDVLNAMNNAQEARHALAVARTEAKIASLLLNWAAGKNP
jgi:outer membrane protein